MGGSQRSNGSLCLILANGNLGHVQRFQKTGPDCPVNAGLARGLSGTGTFYLRDGIPTSAGGQTAVAAAESEEKLGFFFRMKISKAHVLCCVAQGGSELERPEPQPQRPPLDGRGSGLADASRLRASSPMY